jgi:tetratricopeptide (TPR) repeat protein
VRESNRYHCRCGRPVGRSFGSGRRHLALLGLTLALLLTAAGWSVAQDDQPGASKPPAVTEAPAHLAPIREHLLKGRYAEGAEACAELPSEQQQSSAVVWLWSHCLEEQGDVAGAVAQVTAALERESDSPKLLGRLAELQYRQGQFAACAATLARSLAADPDELQSRMVQVSLLRDTGREDEALEASRWFIGHYNKLQPDSAEVLVGIARGVELFALWNPKSQNLNMIINTLCPDALKADRQFWPAHEVAGSLLLEKYNKAQGLPELKKALALNPQASSIYAKLAEVAWEDRDLVEARQMVDRALEINPSCVPALLVRSDLQREGGDPIASKEILATVEKLNPQAAGLWSRRAAASLFDEGFPSDEELDTLFSRLQDHQPLSEVAQSGFGRALATVAAVNPRPARFLTEVGRQAEAKFKFDFAERCYREALRLSQRQPEPRSALGLLSMRTGRLAEAREILDQAFESDPFHVRVSNMRKVVKLLEGYETLETEHFLIRYDSAADRVLARYLADYLESVYPEMIAQYGHAPAQKTQFELFHKAKGVSAHSWFSARLVGLPWIQTIGASTGMIVALSSPTASERPYNWARVAKHEFVHILTLQGTRFNIPHWYTEALAVLAEQTPRPELWNELLRERVPAGKLLNLDTINEGFTRARNQRDWNFAYCQSRLYAEYLQERFGADATHRLLEGYRQGLSTTQALRQLFQVEQAEFEQGYREYLNRVVTQLKGEIPEEPETHLPTAEKAYRAQPNDPAVAARYALALSNVNKRKEARKIAQGVLEKQPKHPEASLVMARLSLRAEDTTEAARWLDEALDRQNPDPRILEARARLHLEEKEYQAAADLYDLGLQQAPSHVAWQKGLATALLRGKQFDRLKPVLEQLSISDGDDPLVRRKRAELALNEKDYPTARRYAELSLEIDVLSPETHEILAQSLGELGEFDRAAREWGTAAECQPKEPRYRVEQARALGKGGRVDDGVRVLEELLKTMPGHTPAQQLLEELSK